MKNSGARVKASKSGAPVARASVGVGTAAAPPLRVLDRNALIAALAEAVKSDSAPHVLVLIGFEGLKEYLEAAPEAAGSALIELLGGQLTREVGGGGRVYESRRGEFCVLLEGRLAAVRSLLVVIPSLLDELARPFAVCSSLGIAVLPDEATIPTYALALADRRLRALSGDLRPGQS